MRGFSRNALILMQDPKKFQESYGGYKEQYITAVKNLLLYLASVDIEPYFLSTDTLAYTLFKDLQGVSWYATENPGGMYFMQNQCGLPKLEPIIPLDPNILSAIDKKFPLERGMEANHRWFVMSKRVAMAEKEIIKQQKAVFVFGSLYKPRTKPDDGKAIVSVNTQLAPKLTLSGYDANINAFLNFPRANMTLTEWGDFNA